MAQENLNTSFPNSGLGDALRNAFIKVQNMFTDLYSNVVFKVTGKDLSTNDFTNALKAKLDGIENFADVNVQSDWLQDDPTAEDYIKNRPVISSNIADGFILADTILINQEFFVSSAQWYVNGQLNILPFQFPNLSFEIPLADTGLQRLDLIYGTNVGTIEIIEGVEAETAIEPTLPPNSVRLTVILSTDTTSTTTPIDLNGFIQKIFASFDKWATNEITLSLDGRTNFIANTALANFKGFNFPNPNDNFYEGKPFILFNNSGSDIVVEEDSADVDLPFAEGYTHENGKLILFVPVLGKLHMVGSAGGTTIHNELTGRDASDAHPISAITGLAGALDAKLETVNTNDIANHAVTNNKLAQMNANTYKGRSSGNGTPQDLSVLGLPISTATQTALNAKIDKAYIPLTLTSNINVSTLEQNRVYVVNLGDADRTIFIDEPTNILFIVASANTLFFDEASTQTLTALNDDLNVAGIGNSMLIENLGTDENFASKKGFTQINPSDYSLSEFVNPTTQRFLRDGIDSKAGIITNGFTGSPLIFDVAFSDFGTTDYTIQICGVDSRQWSYSLKTVTGFRIHTNSSTALTGEVSWRADKI
jgi:hypothetical protein